MDEHLTVGLDAVIVAVTEDEPRILTVRSAAQMRRRAGSSVERTDSLPSGPLDPARDRTLELGVRERVREQTGLELGYVEQLYTFGDRARQPGFRGRLISIAYLALVREGRVSGTREARWSNWYEYFPWEDWRTGPPRPIREVIVPALYRWADRAGPRSAVRARRERVDITFGSGGAGWNGERVLERYELLYEAGLAAESKRPRARERSEGSAAGEKSPGRSMALDHRRILATALGRLRGKIKYRPVVFEVMPSAFTLLELQRVVEALAGVGLHKQNFRRFIAAEGLVEGTGRQKETGGRPAELFRYRPEVLRERLAPGVGLPGARR